MKALAAFSLKPHQGERETWPLESELLLDSRPTGKSIPGYVLDAQYRCGGRYLFVTSWDCLFEESLEVILTDEAFKLVERRSIGAMYTSTWLEHHEPVGEHQLLLHCDDDFQILITVQGTLKVEQKSALVRTAGQPPRKAWWKLW